MAEQGIREVNLISQDSTYYGRDLGLDEGLSQLIAALDRIPDLRWIRVLYCYPEEISDSLLDIMRSDKVCSYIDSPFQHASPEVIRKMGRGLKGSQSLELIGKIRQSLPDAVLRTSLIVGFPGEGPEEFEHLKNFVREASFDHLGVFTYSHEKDTPSFAWQDDIPTQEKVQRRQEIMEMQAEISAQRLKRYVGTHIPVLLEGHLKEKPGMLIGRTQYQAPEVDGVVLIEQPEGPGPLFDVLHEVEILRSDVYDLYGTIK